MWQKIVATISLHRKVFSITTGLVLVLLAGAWSLIPAPSASGAMRGASVEIVRNAEIRVYFSQRMDHGSVERAWILSPAVTGNFRWEDNMVAFKPSSPLDKGQTYTLTIGSGAKNIWLKGLRETYVQQFKVLDYPEVVVAVPEDQSDIRMSQRITVMFDHSLRSLSTKMEVPKMLKISPDVAGAYTWIGASGFEFTPNEKWPAATTFTVTVPKGTKMADGGETIEDKTWSFSTPSVTAEFLQHCFENGYYGCYPQDPLTPTSTISLQFNYPVTNVQSVRDALKMTETNADQSSVVLPTSEIQVTQNPKNPTVLTIRKASNFQLSHSYSLTLPKGLTAGIGPNGLVRDSNSPNYKTDELGFHIVSSTEGEKEWHENVRFNFNNPIRVPDDAKVRAQFVTITPPIKKMTVNMSTWGGSREMWVDGLWQPSTDYTITVSGDLADVYGQKLGKSATVKMHTAQIRPQVKFMGFQDSGVFASYLPRIYQLMSMNQSEPIRADLYRYKTKDFMNLTRYGDDHSNRSFVKRTEFATTEKENHWQLFDVDLNQLNGGEATPGIYQVEFISKIWNKYRYHLPPGLEDVTTTRTLFVSDVAITLKSDAANKEVAWVVDMKTGMPVPNVLVRFYTLQDGRRMLEAGTAKTNADGVATFAGDANAPHQIYSATVDDQGHFGIAMDQWSDGIAPYNFGMNYSVERGNGHQIGYIYTDRLIYRPLHTVHFKGVVRRDLDAKLTIPKQKTIAVTINDANGTVIYTKDLAISPYGTFLGDMNIDPAMPLGSYTIHATLPDEQGDMVGSFNVLEYRRPDFRVTLDVPKDAVAGQKISANVHGAYFFGSPLSKANVHYDLTRNAFHFQTINDEWYSFSEDDVSWCYYDCPNHSDFEPVSSGDAELDEQGNFSIPVPSDLSNVKGSVVYSVTVTVSDENQRSASANDSFVVHKGNMYVGIRPDYANGWDAPTADFSIVSVGIHGEAIGSIPMSVKLFKRTWTNEQTTDANGETQWSSKATETLVDSKALTTDGNGKAAVQFSPKEDGEYVAHVEAKDATGNLVKSAATRWLWRGESASVRLTDDAHMDVKQNAAEYEPGQTAELAVMTPFANTKALVTIERQGIRDVRVIDLTKANRIVKIPITDDMMPNVFVSVTAIQGGGEQTLPQYRMGYARLQVSTKKKQLTYTIETDKKEYGPGDTVRVTVHAMNSSGQPVQAETSIAVVDEKVVALLGSIDKDIFGKFWYPRWIGVSTVETLTQMLKKIWTPEDTVGGGGGKGDNDHPAIRGNFLDTAYWKGDVVTGADGTASLTFKLPDNLTSWQILSIATTKDTAVGSAETSIISKKQLMVEPAMPRILRHGDTGNVGAMLVNGTNAAQTVKITMKAEGVTLDGATTREAVVAPGARLAMSWTAHVPEKGDLAKFTVTAEGQNVSDGFEVSFPLLGYDVMESDSTSGVLKQSASQDIDLPDGTLPNKGDVSVTVTPNSSYSIDSAVQYLLDYEYGCSEQTASAVKAADRYLQLGKLKLIDVNPKLVTKAEHKIDVGLQKLLAMQQPDGGWGWWPEQDKWPSNPWNTAYVLKVLVQLRADGIAVPDQSITKASDYLREVLENRISAAGWYNNDYYKLSLISALMLVDSSGLRSVLDSIYDHRSKYSSWMYIDLADAYAHVDPAGSSGRRRALLTDIRNRMTIIDPTRAYIGSSEGDGRYNVNDVYTTADFLSYLMVDEPNDPQTLSLLRYLLESRANHGWESTYTVSRIMDALIAYTKAHPIDDARQQVNVMLDTESPNSFLFEKGDKSPVQSVTYPMTKLNDMGKRHQITLEKDNDRPYFWDISLKVFREILKVPAYENGFAITSSIFDRTDRKGEHPRSEIKNGSIVRVHLKVIVPKERNNVALEYHLPAGLEAIDFSLRTSPKNIEGDQQQCSPGWDGESECYSESSWEWRWWWGNVWKHIELRDDRVFLFSDRLDPGVYEYDFFAQALTPGEFRIPPARIYEMYNPIANAHTEGAILRVQP